MLKKLDWWLFASASVVALMLGMSGFHAHAQLHSLTQLTWLDLLYRSLQLFTLDSGAIVSPIPANLEIARWLAPFITFFVAIKGILALVHNESKSVLRLRNIQDHTIICGLGNKGSQIAAELEITGQNVVVIDNNADNNQLAILEQKGAIIIIGDAQDAGVLQQAKIQSAYYLIAATDKDSTNIGIIQQAYSLIKSQKQKSKITLNCYAHVADYNTKLLFYNHPLFSENEKRFNAQVFNLYDRGARMLFNQYAPDRYKPIQTKDDPAASILLFGFSSLAKSLILHAARTGHYANAKKLVVSIVGNNAEGDFSSLSLASPALSEVIDASTTNTHLEALTTRQLHEILRSKPTVIFICMESDINAIVLAQRLGQLLINEAIPIVCGLLQQDSLVRLLANGNDQHHPNVHFFPLIEKTCHADQMIRQQNDHDAMVIHDMYCKDQYAQGDTFQKNPSLVPWYSLPEGIKDSNRGQADHLPVKLRALGLSLENAVNSTQALTFSPQQVHLLATMEHRRWVAEKLLDGWRHTSGKKDLKLKLTPLMVDFDDLPEHEKHKDQQIVLEHIPRLIERLKSNQSG